MLWALQLCRICAQIRESCIPIFEKGVDAKIRRCFSSNISKDDLKPKQLCQECYVKLTDFYSFIIMYFESNYRFDAMLYEPTQTTNSVLSQQDCVGMNFPLGSTENNVKAEEKNLSDCSNLAMLPLDEIEVRDFGEPNILNEIVEKTDIDLQIYNDIVGESGSQDLINLKPTNESNPIQSPYLPNKNCQYTQNYYNENLSGQQNNVEKIKIISVETVSDGYKKSLPEQTTNTVETVAKGNKRRNKSNMVSVKSICDIFKKQQPASELQQSSKPRLSRPRKTIDNSLKKRLPCNMCKKTFARRQCLNEHIKKHCNIKPYLCNICEKTFTVQWDLTAHMRIHTNAFSCGHCGKCFNAPSKLQRHVRTHTGERPFVCTVKGCRWSFSDKRNLIGHQLTHTNIRKFTCDICKQTYKTKNQLKDHIQAHSEKHRFKCDQCNKSYKWKTNLFQHLKKHRSNSKCTP